MCVVNGPVRNELGMNCGIGALGPELRRLAVPRAIEEDGLAVGGKPRHLDEAASSGELPKCGNRRAVQAGINVGCCGGDNRGTDRHP